jgi:hypothetical protein
MGKTGLTDEKASRMLAGMREGLTPRSFYVTVAKFKAYCREHPQYGREALPLIEANATAARRRKGATRREQTHCKHGHSLVDAFVNYQNGYIKRGCRTCLKIRGQLGGLMKPEVLVKVTAALKGGATINQIIHGRPLGAGKANPSLRIVDAGILSRYRRENPEFDRFVLERTKDNNRRGQLLRFQRVRNAAVREQNNDYYKILAMLPHNFPDKDDVVGDIFEALLDGSLRRQDIRARVKHYVTAHNRMFPTNFAKFGDGRLVSLDARLFDDGPATLGDSISRGLWD